MAFKVLAIKTVCCSSMHVSCVSLLYCSHCCWLSCKHAFHCNSFAVTHRHHDCVKKCSLVSVPPQFKHSGKSSLRFQRAAHSRTFMTWGGGIDCGCDAAEANAPCCRRSSEITASPQFRLIYTASYSHLLGSPRDWQQVQQITRYPEPVAGGISIGRPAMSLIHSVRCMVTRGPSLLASELIGARRSSL
jgi:hypothetical protein